MQTDIETTLQAGKKNCATCDQMTDGRQHCDKCQTFLARATAGAFLLDEHRPDWLTAQRLKLEKLNMELHGLCLLSQLFSSYENGIKKLGLGPLGIEMGFGGFVEWDSYGWEHGYTLQPSTPAHERQADFARLTEIWKQIIIQKRLDIAQPFQLAIRPLPGGGYVLAMLQRPYPFHHNGQERPLNEIGSIRDPFLSSARDLILEELRTNQFRPTVLQSKKEKRLDLCEDSGVRLSVLFQALSLVTSPDTVSTVQQMLWAMSPEELLYWFSKCSGPNGHRGVRALHILCGGEG